MARKSRWQQFTENFNATYGTFNKAFSDYESAKIMKQDFDDGQGGSLSGSDLDRARYEALAAIKTKYGDAEGGLALRTTAAGLESQNYANDVNKAIKPHVIAQKGELQSGLMKSQINNTNASAANSYSAANARDTLLPYDVAGSVAETEGVQARTTGTRLNNEIVKETMDDTVRTARGNANRAEGLGRQAQSDANVATQTEDARIATEESTAAVNQSVAKETQATEDDRISASIEGLRATAAEAGNRQRTARQTATDEMITNEIISEGMSLPENDTPEKLNAWIIEEALRTDNLSVQGRLALADNVNKLGAEAITSRAMEITQGAEKAWAKDGLGGLEKFYESIQDGVDVVISRSGTSVSAVVVTPDGDQIPLAVANGDNADAQLASQLMARLKSPAAVMAIAAADLETQKAKADIASTEATTGLRAAQTGETKDNSALIRERTKQVAQEINASSPSMRKHTAMAKRMELFSDPKFVEMLVAEPGQAYQAMAQYDRAYDLPYAPPDNMPADLFEEWYSWSPAEQEEFRKLQD